MKFDGMLDIAVGLSAKSVKWKNKRFSWSEFVQKLSEGHKTNETYKEFIAATKAEQGKIKDIGGYVGGYLSQSRRKAENVVYRQLLTLDMDYAHSEFWEDFTLTYDNAAVLHATHKHHELSPRFRLVMPLDREVTPDEYLAIARKIGGSLGIDLFDDTTFDVSRLMFWPSSPRDVEYYFQFQDGPFLNADSILDSYVDWKDTTQWPVSSRVAQDITLATKKQEDPSSKKGIVGAFCRTFSISDAINTFLTDEYEPAGDGRYTYRNGTTAGGLILYDDTFAFSHHGTDPCSGKLCNAFDIVRIHKFGDLDTELDGSKSFKAMEEFARASKEVRKIIASENLEAAKYDFAYDPEDNYCDYEQLEDEAVDWMQDLEVDSKGKYLSSSNNINLILSNDIRLKGLFRYDKFSGQNFVFGNMPWRRVPSPEPFRNVDYAGIRNYIESIYGITGALKIQDALELELERNSFHPIIDYLKNLTWDGIPRIDNLLIDYFGADDNAYSREAIRVTLLGAVHRVFEPGYKFDYVLVLSGPQGTYKSTFFKRLGRSWFSDTFLTVQGKEALEQIQGSWIIEMAELSGLRKAEVQAVRHFISKQEDIYRPAYARTTEQYKRQCIFVGTTNDKVFLNDIERRFNPIDVEVSRVVSNVFYDLVPEEIDQIWAEAMYMRKNNYSTVLSNEAKEIAEREQKTHRVNDERTGVIDEFVNTPLPKNWADMDIFDRRNFLTDPLKKGTIERDIVCIAEIWCECMGKNKEDMDRYKTRDINDIMRSLDGWELQKSTKTFKWYGKQKYYARVKG